MAVEWLGWRDEWRGRGKTNEKSENRNQKLEIRKREESKNPPLQNPQGWATQEQRMTLRLRHPPGWERFGRLVVYERKPGWFISFGQQQTEETFPPRVVDVWRALNRHSKSMVHEKNRSGFGPKRT